MPAPPLFRSSSEAGIPIARRFQAWSAGATVWPELDEDDDEPLDDEPDDEEPEDEDPEEDDPDDEEPEDPEEKAVNVGVPGAVGGAGGSAGGAAGGVVGERHTAHP